MARLTLFRGDSGHICGRCVGADPGRTPGACRGISRGLCGICRRCDDRSRDRGDRGSRVLTPRLAIGPEFVYMWGPNWDRDLFLTGNLTFDLLPPRGGRARRVTPFLIAGGGLSQHSDRFGPFFTSCEGIHRRWGSPRMDYRPCLRSGDIRFGWELHARVNAGAGVQLGR